MEKKINETDKERVNETITETSNVVTNDAVNVVNDTLDNNHDENKNDELVDVVINKSVLTDHEKYFNIVIERVKLMMSEDGKSDKKIMRLVELLYLVFDTNEFILNAKDNIKLLTNSKKLTINDVPFMIEMLSLNFKQLHYVFRRKNMTINDNTVKYVLYSLLCYLLLNENVELTNFDIYFSTIWSLMNIDIKSFKKKKSYCKSIFCCCYFD